MRITEKEKKAIEWLMQNQYDLCLSSFNGNAYDRHQNKLWGMMDVMQALGYDAIDDNGTMRLVERKDEKEDDSGKT